MLFFCVTHSFPLNTVSLFSEGGGRSIIRSILRRGPIFKKKSWTKIAKVEGQLVRVHKCYYIVNVNLRISSHGDMTVNGLGVTINRNLMGD